MRRSKNPWGLGRDAQRVALALVLACVSACLSERRAPQGPPIASPAAGATREASNGAGTCVSCHAREVREWDESMHHASFTSADFQRSYRAEPRDYCAACHAPLRAAGGSRDFASGIGCVSCHAVPEGHLAQARADRPHATTRDCRGCHDFDVPGTRAILQSTAREHAESSFAATTCEQCHMAASPGGGRDHRFAVTRDPALLRRALSVSAARVDAEGLVVQLAARGVGHRFPTGDIYRRLTITLTAYDAAGALIAGDTFHLGRDWDTHRASLTSGLAEVAVADTRLSEAARDFRLPCTKTPARVHLTATYERGAAAQGAFFESFQDLEILDTDLETTRAPERHRTSRER